MDNGDSVEPQLGAPPGSNGQLTMDNGDSVEPSLTLALLYLNFHLCLSGLGQIGRWDCLPACRREGSGANEFVALWRGILSQHVGSLNHLPLCPKLEPLMERPVEASSYLQE